LAGYLSWELFYMGFASNVHHLQRGTKMMKYFNLKMGVLKSSEQTPQIMQR